MIYVMLSRAQTIEQIFIMDSLHKDKRGWRPDPSALEELESSRIKAINTVEETEVDELKILCLNVYSLKKHFVDVERIVQAMASLPSAICLQETWLNEGDDVDRFHLQDLKLIVNSKGRGRGVATYFDDTFDVTDSVNTDICQITKISSNDIDVINVYRSKECNVEEFKLMIFKMIDKDMFRNVLICGDVNVHFKDGTSNSFVRKIIDEYKFEQLVLDATHNGGNTLDHVYVSPALQGRVTVEKACIYYSDHDLLTIKVIGNNKVEEMSVSD